MNAPLLREAPRNVLVVALDGAPLNPPRGRLLVVAPAVNSRLRRWASDEDRARRGAAERLSVHLAQLERRGLHAEGRVGDADSLLAIGDALATFPADEIVIAGAVPDVEKLIARARKRFQVPTTRVAEPMPLAA